MAKRSQVIQRGLPRPNEVNMNVLRPTTDASLTDVQRAEELIKQEMITMMQYDALKNPINTNPKRAPMIERQAKNWLEQHPYEEFAEEDIVAVSIDVSSKFLMLL